MLSTERRVAVLAVLLFAVSAVVAGCLIWQKVTAGKGKQEDGTRWEAVLGPGADDERGHLKLRITAIHERQQPMDQAPWHQPGGQWTFLECTTVSAPPVAFLVGVSPDSPAGDRPLAWGQAIVAVQGGEQGAQLVNALARAFRATAPTPRPGQPVGRLKLHTAVLGENMRRDSAGGFSNQRGEWTATKWFLEDEEVGEAEVFFNRQ